MKIYSDILCLHLMNSEVAWILVSSGTQVQPEIILNPDYLPDYHSIFYDDDKPLQIYYHLRNSQV